MTTQRLQSFVNQRGAGSFVISLLVLLALTSGVFVGSQAVQNRALNLGAKPQASGCNYNNPYQCNGHDGCTWTDGSCQSTSTSSNPPAQPPGGSTGGGNQTGNQSGGSTGDVCAGQRRVVCEGNLRQFCTWCNDECVAGNSCLSRPGGGSGSGSQCQRPRTGECMTRNSRGCTLNSGQVGTCEHPGTTQKQCCAASSPDTGRTDTTRSSCEQGGGRCIQSTDELASCLGAGGHYGQGDPRGCPNFPGYGGICCKTNWERPRTGGGVPPHSTTGCLVGQAADFCYGPRTPGVPREPRTGESCPLSATQTGVCLRESGIIKCCPRGGGPPVGGQSQGVDLTCEGVGTGSLSVGQLAAGKNIDVCFTVVNKGNESATPPISYSVKVTGPKNVEKDGQSQTTILAGSSSSFCPAVKVPEALAGKYDVEASINVAGDANSNNNKCTGSFTIGSAKVTIKGFVYRDGNTPVSGARVSVQGANPTGNTATTNSQGAYTLTLNFGDLPGTSTTERTITVEASVNISNRLYRGEKTSPVNPGKTYNDVNLVISSSSSSSSSSVSGRAKIIYDSDTTILTGARLNVVKTEGEYRDGGTSLGVGWDKQQEVNFAVMKYSDGINVTVADKVKVNFCIGWQAKNDASKRGEYCSDYVTDITPGVPYPNLITVNVPSPGVSRRTVSGTVSIVGTLQENWIVEVTLFNDPIVYADQRTILLRSPGDSSRNSYEYSFDVDSGKTYGVRAYINTLGRANIVAANVESACREIFSASICLVRAGDVQNFNLTVPNIASAQCSGIRYTFSPSEPYLPNQNISLVINRASATSCFGNWENVGLLLDGNPQAINLDGDGYQANITSGSLGIHRVRFTVNNGSCYCNPAAFETKQLSLQVVNFVEEGSSAERIDQLDLQKALDNYKECQDSPTGFGQVCFDAKTISFILAHFNQSFTDDQVPPYIDNGTTNMIQ